MSFVESVVVRDPHDVERRLAELKLGPRHRLLAVVAIAIAAGADATAFYPLNAAGTLAYQHGTAALREEFVDEDWALDRSDGVEAIRDDKAKVKVIFANVDTACRNDLKPKPRSRKGAGSERACMGNLFGSLPEYAPRQPDGWATYYLMVDENGSAELTRPVVKDGTFTAYIERIFLAEDGILERDPFDSHKDDEADEFDPQVIRKK